MKNRKTNIVTSQNNSLTLLQFFLFGVSTNLDVESKLENLLTSGPRHLLSRVPWATIFYAFQHH